MREWRDVSGLKWGRERETREEDRETDDSQEAARGVGDTAIRAKEEQGVSA